MSPSSAFEYSNRGHRSEEFVLLLCAPVWPVEQAVGAHTAVCADPCFWPQPLTGAYRMHPAGSGTHFTLCKQTILGNSVHLGSIR